MPTLTSLLSRDGVVSLDTIEQALQRQVLEGGELDTALLELSRVPENVRRRSRDYAARWPRSTETFAPRAGRRARRARILPA